MSFDFSCISHPWFLNIVRTIVMDGSSDAVVFPVELWKEILFWMYNVSSLDEIRMVPDVVWYEPRIDDATKKVEQYSTKYTDEIITRAFLAPYGPIALIVIDHIEMMPVSSANKFLKTLEDIPEKTLFVLLTDTPNHLLPTIRSRVKVLESHEKVLDSSVHRDHPIRQALDLWLEEDYVGYYEIMVNDLKKITDPRSLCSEICESHRISLHERLLSGEYHQRNERPILLSKVLTQALEDLENTNLPIRAILDNMMAGLIV